MNKEVNKNYRKTIPIAINATIFLILSIIHFYWTFGGKIGYDDVLPTNSKGYNQLNPSLISSLIVSFGLIVLALVTIGNQGLFDTYLKRKYFRFGAISIFFIFLLRAIGDFKFVGFFKKVNQTRFGLNDTYIFSPLCLFIAFISLIIFVQSREVKS
ncbi:MAG: DUF3995 domain-containing protein [Leadbetterella sp.]